MSKNKTLECRVGEKLKIDFEAVAMPYSWNCRSAANFDVERKVIPNLNAIGGGPKTEFTLTAKSAGTHEVVFSMGHPSRRLVDATKTYTINVKP